jgi:hypothetical protein
MWDYEHPSMQEIARRRRSGERTGCWVAMLSELAVMGSGAWSCCSTTEGIFNLINFPYPFASQEVEYTLNKLVADWIDFARSRNYGAGCRERANTERGKRGGGCQIFIAERCPALLRQALWFACSDGFLQLPRGEGHAVAWKRDMSQREARLKALQYKPLRQVTGLLGIDQLGGKENLPRTVIWSPACMIHHWASVSSKEHLLDSFTQGYANSSQPRWNQP